MKIAVIDNYDSFTYNLVHYFEEINGERPAVFRNDQVTLQELSEYDCLVLSPGPGLPKDAGILMEIIRNFAPNKIILGICLGHQALGEYFGGKLENLTQVHHGISSKILIENDSIIYGELSAMEVGRYHSWSISNKSFPKSLIITSKDEEDTIMSFKHISLPIHGIQFHPESILTPIGKTLIKNFVQHYSTRF